MIAADTSNVSPAVLVIAFALTLAIEVPIVVGLAGRFTRWSTARCAWTAVAANTITHPLGIGVALPALGASIGVTWALIIVEALVVVIEAAMYTFGFHDGVVGSLLSGTANLASFSIGAVILR